jgi:hypothetical protein
MSTKHTVVLTILAAVVVLPVAAFVAWVRPWQGGILVQGQSADGQEFCVVQTFKGLVEPYQVSFYIRDNNRVWRWNYLEHEDTAWRSASVEFVSGKAIVSRNGKPFREVGMPTGTFDLASVPSGYVDDYCPPEFTVQDVLRFHNGKYQR